MSLIATTRSCARLATSLVPGDGVYRHQLTLIDGTRLGLGGRRGNPTLIVNTASQCPYARQLYGLQSLSDEYGDAGLMVIGCPSAEFGALEHEDLDAVVASYREYGVEFPLTEPMSVRFRPDGLWREIAAQPGSGAPVWNFNKYLIDGDGRVQAWWSTNVQPAGARISGAIERLLARRPSRV